MLAPRHRPERRRRVPDEALGERRAVGADDLDRVVDVERAVDLAHAGGEQRPVVGAQARGARRRRRRCVPAAPRANAIHSLRLESRCGLGRTAVPTARPSIASTIDVGHVGAGDHRAHTRPRRDLRRRELARHPAAPARGAGAAGDGFERGVDLDDLLDQRRVLVEARIGGEEPGRVGEQDEHVGLHEVRHERGEPVVVAVADLVVGDGVVLVDDRDHTEVEQPAQRVAGVQVLRAHAEVVRREQHLAGEEVVLARGSRRAAAIEQRLPDRGDRPAASPMSVGRVGETERGQARSRSRRSTRARPRGPRSRAVGDLAAQLRAARRRRARPSRT